MTCAVVERTAAVATVVLEAASLEEGGHGRFTIGALHGFHILEHDEAAGFAHRPLLHGAFYPYGFALVTRHRAGDVRNSGLTRSEQASEAEHGGEEQCFHGVCVV